MTAINIMFSIFIGICLVISTNIIVDKVINYIYKKFKKPGKLNKLADERHGLLCAAYAMFEKELCLTQYRDKIWCRAVNDIPGGAYGVCEAQFRNNYKDLHKLQILVKCQPSLFGMVETLAHEMVHAWQWINGRLHIEIKKTWYGKKRYVRYFMSRVDEENYENQSCEEEAFVKQVELCAKFIEYLYQTKKVSKT